MKMKEINSKILDEFIARNHQESHYRFTYALFQDVACRFSVHSAYSRYLNDRYCFDQQNRVKNESPQKTKEDSGH